MFRLKVVDTDKTFNVQRSFSVKCAVFEVKN